MMRYLIMKGLHTRKSTSEVSDAPANKLANTQSTMVATSSGSSVISLQEAREQGHGTVLLRCRALRGGPKDATIGYMTGL